MTENQDFKYFVDVTFKNWKNSEVKDPFEIVKIPKQDWKGKEEDILWKHIKSIEFFKEYHEIIVD